jgi:uncharacterized protein YndB with AHSA1/START domain
MTANNPMTERGTARKTPDGYEVIFERYILHPSERVWAMLTGPENIETWFCARVDIDHRLGGRMVEHHDHVGVDVHGEVTRWEPPRVFEHSWWFGEPKAAFETESSSRRAPDADSGLTVRHWSRNTNGTSLPCSAGRNQATRSSGAPAVCPQRAQTYKR